MNQHPTAEEFAETVLSEIRASCIEIHEDFVKLQCNKDEGYFSHDKRVLCGKSQERIWFKTQTDEFVVKNRLSVLLGKWNLNRGIVSSKPKGDGVVKYTITVPFITEKQRQLNIREDTVDLATDMREYKDVPEDDVVGDCPYDDCDGDQYRNGMGDVGPQYNCTRFECGFKYVRCL